MTDEPQLLLSPETLIYLFNIAAASCLACGSGLLAAWLCGRRPAPLKHAILLAAMCLSLFSPAVLSLSQALGRGMIRVPTPFHAVLSERDDVLLEPGTSLHSIGRSAPVQPSVVDRHESVIATRPSPEVPGVASDDTTAGINWRFWGTVGTILGCIWAVGTVLNVVVLGRGVIALIRFRTSLTGSDNPRITQAARWAMRTLRSRQDVAVRSSHLIPSPLSLGPVRPVIAIPEGIEHKLDNEQLRAVFVHEVAHIVRGDHWIGLLQRAAEVLFWWNPLLRRASRCVSLLREQICDDHVVSAVGDGRRYAETLLEVAGYCALPPGRTCAVGLLGHESSDLAGRITRLLDKERTMSTQMNRRMFALAAGFTAALFGLLLVPAVEATDELAKSAAGSANTLHTVQQARQAIKARLNALQSVVVKYDRIDTYTPVPEFLKPPQTVTVKGLTYTITTGRGGTEKRHCKFRYLAGLVRYEQRLSQEMLDFPNQIQARFRIKSILLDRVEHLGQQPPDGMVTAYIRSYPPELPSVALIDTGLGLRILGESTWLTDALLDKFDLEIVDANLAVLRTGRWQGKPFKDMVHEWVFDRRLGYALISYRRHYEGRDADVFSLRKHEKVGKLYLPKEIRYHTPYHRRKKPWNTQVSVLKIAGYKIDDPENTPEAFPIDWPKDIRVWDQRNER